MATLSPSPQEGLDPSLGGVEDCGKEREVLPHAGDSKFFLREFNCMSKIQRMMKHLKVFVSSAGLPSVHVILLGASERGDLLWPPEQKGEWPKQWFPLWLSGRRLMQVRSSS